MGFVWQMFLVVEKMNSLPKAFKTSDRKWVEGKGMGAIFKDRSTQIIFYKRKHSEPPCTNFQGCF